MTDQGRDLHRLAADSAAAPTARESAAIERAIAATLAELLERDDETALARVFETAPTRDVYRLLWRVLESLAGRAAEGDSGVGVALFAIPLVVVAGSTRRGATLAIPGIVADPAPLAAILRKHGALEGNPTLALANALAATDAIELRRLPLLLRNRRTEALAASVDVAPAPIPIADEETADLRFLVGAALMSSGAELPRTPLSPSGAAALARSLTSALSIPGASVLALPRGLHSLPAAVAVGQAAQREVAAQLFISRSVREIRATVGEPVATIAAQADVVELCLVSPLAATAEMMLESRVHAGERPADVVTMLADLLHDCRIADVRVSGDVAPARRDAH
ncbi:MAG TPA: hypothetical protein VNE58_18250 [Casimicrobiaceae bacterium]|nr:hypothetical protein [Casimicrobiaceae bacterium]